MVCIKSERREIKLGVIIYKNGKAQIIFNQLTKLLNKYDVWNYIKMTICDTTNVNTELKNGVVKKLRNEIQKMSLEAPQYVECQYHILDRIIKNVLDRFGASFSTKLTLSNPFVEEIINDYFTLCQSL